MPAEIVAIAITGIVFFGGMMPALIGSFSYAEKRLKLKQALAAGEGAESRAEHAETSTELARLRDRVAVLERLLTDDDRKLASEIDRLSRAPHTSL